MTDKWTDDGRTHSKIMLLHTLTIWGSDLASMVVFRTVVWEGLDDRRR